MKNNLIVVFLFAAILMVGCGGGGSTQTVSQTNPTPAAAPKPTPTGTESPILGQDMLNAGMIGQVWEFQNGYGDKNFISIESPQTLTRKNSDGTTTNILWNDQTNVLGRTGDNLVFHYYKSNCRTYWALGVCNAELWFVLHRENDNSWRSTGSLINFMNGCPWCPEKNSPSIGTFQVADNAPGMPLPYLIAPPTTGPKDKFVNETKSLAFSAPGLSYDNQNSAAIVNAPNTGEYWRTDFYMEWVETPVYKGWAIVSDQFEADCGHERWFFAPQWGLIRVESLNDGGQIKNNPSCKAWGVNNGFDPHDPKLTIERTR
jgi:hypothetical protein